MTLSDFIELYDSTPLDRINYNDQIDDDRRLEKILDLFDYTKELVETGYIKTKVNIGWSFKNCDKKTRYITNILQSAAMFGHIKTFMHFIPEEELEYYYLHLAIASTYNQFDIIRYLLENHRERVIHLGNTALHTAIVSRANLKIIKYIIDNGEDINAKNNVNETPLFMAVKAHRLNVIKCLVEHGADFNSIMDEKGNIPLDYAIQKEENYFFSKEIINYLLLKGAHMNSTPELIQQIYRKQVDLNDRDQFKMPILHYAIQNNDLKLSKVLIRQGANVNIKDNNGRTPLHWASSLNQCEIVELLLQYGAIYNESDIENNMPINFVNRHGENGEKICSLLELFNSGNLFQVLNKMLLSTTQVLKQNAPNYIEYKKAEKWGPYSSPNVYDGNPGVYDGNLDVYNDNPDATDGTNFALSTVQVLLKMHQSMPQVSKQNAEMMHSKVEVYKQKVETQQATAQVLMQNKANYMEYKRAKKWGLYGSPDVYDGNQDAIDEERFRLSTLQLLVKILPSPGECDSNSDVNDGNNSTVIIPCILNAKNSQGKTLLHIAAETNDIEAINILLKFNDFNNNIKANNILLEINDPYRKTLETWFSYYKDYQSISIDAKDKNGNSPLHLASEKGYSEIVSKLLSKGAIFNSKNKNAETPEMLAIKNDHRNVIELLNEVKDLFNAIKENNFEKVKKCIYNNIENKFKKVIEALDESKDVFNIENLFKSFASTSTENESEKNAMMNNITGKAEKWIKSRGEYINVKDENGKTPLHYAASLGQPNIVQFLLQYDANIESKDNNNCTPLHFATQNNKFDNVILLLKNGAAFNTKNCHDKAPFELGENQSQKLLNAINQLFNQIESDNPDEIRIYFLYYLHNIFTNIFVGHYITSIHVEYGKDIINTIINARDDQGNTIFHYAANCGYFSIVQYLLKNGAIYNAENNQKKNFRILRDKNDKTLFLGSQENIFLRSQDYNPKLYSSHRQIKDLLQSIDDIFQKVFKVKDYVKQLKSFMKNKDNRQIILNAREYLDGNTLLHKAALVSNIEIVKLLVIYGADIKAQNKHGQIPKMLASKSSNIVPPSVIMTDEIPDVFRRPNKEIVEYLNQKENAME